MKNFKSTLLKVVFVTTSLILFIGCKTLNGPKPTLDKELPPPIIGKPIYRCAQIISFSGADRDSRIIVYVNGKDVKQINTWLGWGSIKLPNPLKIGDVVSAAQVVNKRVSWETREPVTVVDIPPNLRPGRKLNPPEVVPPIYECQKVVIVKNVLEGATVVLGNRDGDTWKDTTPGSVIRFFRSPIRLEEKWFNAYQTICKDPPLSSDWSKNKVEVQKKPSNLVDWKPKIREPFVLGNDACIVDFLVTGAEVDIYAKTASSSVRVGGGPAPAEHGSVFKIDPPMNKKFKYDPIQSLCDIKSKATKGISPVEVPTPIIVEPICEGHIYITICNTAVLSQIKVYADGVQVAQAAGNGGAVTMALGGTTKFAKGQQVTAKQFVGGKGQVSAPVTVKPANICEKWYSFVSSFRTELLKSINKHRASNGKGPLKPDLCRHKCAQDHSCWMRCKGLDYFKKEGHDPHGGPGCPIECPCIPENVHFISPPNVYAPTPQQLAQETMYGSYGWTAYGWTQSPGHNTILLLDNSTEIGIGLASGKSGGRQIYYVTAKFD